MAIVDKVYANQLGGYQNALSRKWPYTLHLMVVSAHAVMARISMRILNKSCVIRNNM